jgi:hypothetical protein
LNFIASLLIFSGNKDTEQSALDDGCSSLSTGQIAQFVQEAELIYQEQLNIEFKTLNLTVDTSFTSITNAGSHDTSAILGAFGTYTRISSYYKKVDLYHLLSAADFTGSTIGIAYVSVLCCSQYYAKGAVANKGRSF